MRAALYIRVSTEEQAREGYSVDSQTEVGLRWIQQNKHELVDTYVDEGFTSKNLKRPDVQRMIADAEKNKFDLLVFWRLNRLTRNVKDKVSLFELFDTNRIAIKSMTEELDTTTASGRMITNILVSVAQGEREQISENVHATMYERAMKGIRQGAVAPYGYSLHEKQLSIVPHEAEIVKRIFEMYQSPMSDITIAKHLNADRVPRSSGKWSGFAINYILTNPTYCGRLRWNFRKIEGKRTYQEIIVPGTQEAIISEELFDRIQAMRKRRSVKREKVVSHYAFTGILRCNRCGSAMIGKKQTRQSGKYTRYYACHGRSNSGICNMPLIQEGVIERMFLDALKEDSEQFKKLLVFEEVKIDDKATIALQNELEQIQKRKRKWQEAFANDAITLADLKARTAEEKAKEDIIVGKLQVAPEKEKSSYSQKELLGLIKTFADLWHSVQDERAKKSFVQEVFSMIKIDSEMERGVIGGPNTYTPAHIVDWSLNV